MDTQQSLLRANRIRPWEPVLWLLAFAAPALMPSQALMINEIAYVALFAVSLDLVLGYGGIVSLVHKAFFGVGASADVLRGTDLTRLMVTLGVALLLYELANKLDWITGGMDGIQGLTFAPVLGKFEFDLSGQTAAYYSLAVLFVLFLAARRIVRSPFGATLEAIRDNRLRAMAIGIPVHARLVSVYTIAAAMAGAAGALFTQTSGFASIEVLEFHRSADVMLMLVIGGVGWLYGGIVGAVVFKLLQDVISQITPQYWTFWIGLFLVVLVLVGRERLFKPWTWFGKGGKA